jgi:hypothetical protein
MNESVKPRFAIDLDEIERQLAEAQASPHHASQTHVRNDPLAELARIVGQEDPFRSMLTADQAARPRATGRGKDQAGVEELFAARPEGVAPDLRGSFAPNPDHPGAPPPVAGDYDPDYEQPYYAADEEAYAAPAPHSAARRGRRKGLVVTGVVLGAAVVGLGGAFALIGETTMLPSGEPPLIQASNGPTKVQPQSPGGVEIPNQNKQIYERAAQEAATKVVTREEQPVDVRQAARTASTEATGAVTPAAGGLNLGEPRKVRTVSIRPDGSVVGSEGAAPAMKPPAPAPTAAPAPAGPGAAMAIPAPRPAAATPSQAPAIPAATPPSAGGASPQAQASATPAAKPPAPAPAPAPQRVASAEPTALPAAPSASEAVATGGFAVQLGVSSTEADAKATLQRLQGKHAALGGLAPMIRKAEVNGNTVYRVRVGPFPREDASALCSKIQGQGGQCFVAKN